MASTARTTKVVTGEVRLGYVHLFEPFAMEAGQDPKYSCTIIIPKKDKATLRKISAAFEAAAEAGAAKFGGKVPKNVKTTLKDGDEDADLEQNPELEGCYYMAIRSSTRPGVLDSTGQPILDSSEVYSGCYARVSMNAFAYNTSGNKGLSFGLNNVMKVRDGDYLGGRTKAEDDFADFIDGNGDDDDEDGEGIL